MAPSSRRGLKVFVSSTIGLGLVVAPLVALPSQASVDGTGVVINEAYLSGGSAGAAFKNKFIELYNPTDAAVDLSGWSLQYRSATGTGAATGVAKLTGEIAPNDYFLVQANSNGANGTELPAADLVSTLTPSGTTGTIALVKSTTAVTLPTGSVTAHSAVVDLLGYGTSNTFETQVAVAPSGNTDVKSLNRTEFADTDGNRADFSLSATITPTASGTTESDPDPTPTPEPTTPPVPTPTEPVSIAAIQGTGTASPLVGKTVTTSGVVTAAYPTGGLNGYYIQTAGTGGADDATPGASDGIFVYSTATVASVAVGDHVTVTGVVSEYFGLTQITVSAGNVTKHTEAATAPIPAAVAWPAAEAEREALEGMLLQPQGAFTVSDTYSTNQYGEVGLAAGDSPLVTPTAVGRPGSAEYTATIADNAARGVLLDDGASTNFMNAANKSIPLPYVSLTEPVRVGAAATFDSPVVLSYGFDLWRFQPVTALTGDNAATVQPVSFENTRTAAPEAVGGDVTLATFNVLNYFTTTGDSLTGCTSYRDRAGEPVTVNSGCDARGAWDAADLERQQAKIVDAINALDADVVSLEEIENSAAFGKDRDTALATLVDALNADLNSADLNTAEWSFVKSPAAVPASEDVIRTAYIYKDATVAPVGESVILHDELNFDNAREPLAQLFAPANGGDEFIVIANHFKSKGSGSGANADQGDGQGASNPDRIGQAEALVAFADGLKTEKNADRVFLVGDFNSYLMEDPIQVLTEAGYVDQGSKTGEYTYSFDGMVGSLDHVFASAEADASVTGVDVWNINSGESIALEYSRHNYNVTNFYEPNAYRSSDHDPVVVGIATAGAPVDINLLNLNDFHGRIDANTVKVAGTIELLRAAGGEDNTLLLSAGDNIGASLFASASQLDQPTIDVLNALGLHASAVGNHEFDQGLADLTGRVDDAADWTHLGANVYVKGTTDPALEEYVILEVDGVSVGVIGAVTKETGSLVSPGGIASIEFGDPVAAVNRVAAQLTDGDASNGEADVIVAEYHEGAGTGATLDEAVAAGGAFAEIVTDTAASVDAIFTGHTHRQYVWDAPIPGVDGATRPIVQTGSYGENIGQIQLTYDADTDSVVSYQAGNVARTTTADGDLVAAYPRVAEVQTIVDAALAAATIKGNEPVGSVTADISRAFTATGGEDRGAESTLGNLIADALLESLSDQTLGGAEIGVVNPGGIRADLLKGDDGVITFAEANAVLPFLNNLWTTTLTGEQVKVMLEQQWQRTADGAVPSRAFLNLGLSKNVSYTYDATRAEGDRITSITVNGEPIDPARDYRIGSFSFLLQGGDNFHVFAQGTNTRDSGLVDRDAWIDYVTAASPLAPAFDRRGVQLTGIPETAVKAGDTVTLNLSKLDLTSKGSPANTELAIAWEGSKITFAPVPVTAGAATVTITVPKDATAASVLVLTANQSQTEVRVELEVSEKAKKDKKDKKPKKEKVKS
ncbi:ExeM/NucH family extracellular endonuclease [Salinibacterium sp. ZJ454]|uniref:ExeM/NucH family extracellular endonuclease n=1 Tax=Salinibacterium sp. ZJ454 TaxID=2708339 RepID=UPI001422E57A|nr:ExeM/NucH family extracellular endonuclease [Salinibacterium sp. ZJ454]